MRTIQPRGEKSRGYFILAAALAFVIVRDRFSRESCENSRDELDYNADRLIDLTSQRQPPYLR